jgi:hypothetical protein
VGVVAAEEAEAAVQVDSAQAQGCLSVVAPNTPLQLALVALLERRMAMVEMETTPYLAPSHQPAAVAALLMSRCREMQTETTAVLAAAAHINLPPAPALHILILLAVLVTLQVLLHRREATVALEKVLLRILALAVVVVRPLLERLEQLRLAAMVALVRHPPLAGAA